MILVFVFWVFRMGSTGLWSEVRNARLRELQAPTVSMSMGLQGHRPGGVKGGRRRGLAHAESDIQVLFPVETFHFAVL